MVSPHEDIPKAIIGFLDRLKQARLAGAGSEDDRSIEENTDLLTKLLDLASEWPRFSETPPSYQTALLRFIMKRRENFGTEQSITQNFASDVFDAVREMPKSHDLLYRMVQDYGVRPVTITISASSLLFSARDISHRKGGKPDDSMEAVACFISNLDYKFVRNNLLYIAHALLEKASDTNLS